MKFQKRKFQTVLSAEKVNFRGHQKALMRIMDGTSRKLDTAKRSHREEKMTTVDQQIENQGKDVSIEEAGTKLQKRSIR